MSSLRAADLTTIRCADPLWRWRISGENRREAGRDSELAARIGLPPQGFASPLGFWFAPEEEWLSPPPYLLERIPPRRPGVRNRIGLRGAGLDAQGNRRALVTQRQQADGSTKARRRRLGVTVGDHSAIVETDPADWPEADASAMLTVATCWRLQEIDRSFDLLAEQARVILSRSTRIGLKSRRSADLFRDGRSLILDLPEFEGPLTDPSRFLCQRESTELYRRLCTRLGLFDWRDRIDERAEVLDGILDTIHARIDHRQVITLEFLIILLLAIDVALSQFLMAWE